MEHTPPFSSVHPLEGIQTANKNIYSYFMKNDSSYYVPQSHKYAAYKKDSDITYIVVISKYTSLTGDYVYSHNSSSIELECLIGKAFSNLQTKKVQLSNLFEAVKDIEYSLPGTNSIKPSKVFIGLVYPDGLNRVSIMNMVDCVLNHAGFKGILILPMSLSVSLGLGASNSVYFSPCDKTIALIEDNCISDAFTENMFSSTSMYGCDIVEEFLKKDEAAKSRACMLACHMCNTLFEIEEFGMHFLNKHMINIYKDQEKSSELLHKCEIIYPELAKDLELAPSCLLLAGKDMIQRITPLERAKKITSSVILVTARKSSAGSPSAPKGAADAETQYAPAEIFSSTDALPEDSKIIADMLEDASACSFLCVPKDEKEHVAWSGLFALTNIDPCKDIWMTDKEWQAVGLRVLKEKVLFPI